MEAFGRTVAIGLLLLFLVPSVGGENRYAIRYRVLGDGMGSVANGKMALQSKCALFTGNQLGKVAGSPDGGWRLPLEYALSPNYPNPFNSTTTLPLALPVEGKDGDFLGIYNSLGQMVRVWKLNGWEPGVHTVEWDGRDMGDRAVGSGLYLARLRAGKFGQTRKLLMLR